MFGLVILFVLFVAFIKLSWFLLSVGGKALDLAIGFLGYLLLAFFAISALSLSTLVFPFVIIAGIISLIAGMAR